jgi:N utilization substance protein A
MKSEFLLAFNEVCSDRGLPREIVLNAVESALVSAYRRNVDIDDTDNVTAKIDPSTGEARVFVEKAVVEEVSDPEYEISLKGAQDIKPDIELGDTIVIDDTPENFGRIAAQTAKQVILQRIREAERDAQYEHYVEQEGEIVHGTVQSVRSNVVLLNLGSAEAILPRSQQVPGERYHMHQRLRAYVLEVRNTNRGPKIVLSRSHPKMLRRLLELEVPEIFNGSVEIKAIAREAGSRSKVAVIARQPGVDPVGACVGMRGVRIKSIVNELGGEKIDVIEWSPDMGTFIAKALSPAKVLSVQLDEDPDGRKSASVVVPDDQLSLAIGRSGQNARLAAKLSDHRIDIQGVTEAASWAMERVNEDPDVLPSMGPAADLLPRVANILQVHEEEEDSPYSSDELLAMRQVIEAVWRHYASIRRAERERCQAQEKVRRAALEKAREMIPPQAYETPVTEMDVSARALARLEKLNLENVGQIMERLTIDGDEGLLDLKGLGPKTVSSIKESIKALELPSVQRIATETEEVMEETETEVASKTEALEVERAEALEESVIEEEVAEPVEAEEIVAEAEEAPEEVAAEGLEESEAVVEPEPEPADEVEVVEEASEKAEEAEAVVETVAEDEVAVEEKTEKTVAKEESPEGAPAEVTTASQEERDEEDIEGEAEDEEEDEEETGFFQADGEPIDREDRLKRERGRRVQLVYDEETGELIPRRRRKREDEDWQEFLDY